MLNPDQLAKKLGVSRRHIQLMAEARMIPFYRVGTKLLRFDESEVLKAIHYDAERKSSVGAEQSAATVS